MPPSRAFFIALPLGLVIAVGGFGGLFRLQLGADKGGGPHALSQVMQHKEAVAEAMGEPRLLLVGGSGTMFGVLAGRIEEATGIPTVNLASHAGLGVEYVLGRVLPLLREGDTVVLILEYELYDQGVENMYHWANAFFIDFLTSCDPGYFQSLPLDQQLGLAIRMPFRKIRKGVAACFRKPASSWHPIYDVENVDDHGDLIRHHLSDRPAGYLPDFGDAAVTGDETVTLGNTNTNRAGWPVINRFLAAAEAKGVRVLAAFPNVPEDSYYSVPEYQGKLDLIREFYLDRGVPVLGTAQDAMLPPTEFFDSVYHPLHEASEQRTARLIQLLEPFLTESVDPGRSPSNRSELP